MVRLTNSSNLPVNLHKNETIASVNDLVESYIPSSSDISLFDTNLDLPTTSQISLTGFPNFKIFILLMHLYSEKIYLGIMESLVLLVPLSILVTLYLPREEVEFLNTRETYSLSYSLNLTNWKPKESLPLLKALEPTLST